MTQEQNGEVEYVLTAEELSAFEAGRREARVIWEEGVRAMARAVMECDVYSAALDAACDALIAKGPPA